MTAEPLDLTPIEARRLDALDADAWTTELLHEDDRHAIGAALRDLEPLLAEVKRLRAAEGRIRALAARHQRIAALQTNRERLVMVPAITVTEDILAALDPTSEDTP